MLKIEHLKIESGNHSILHEMSSKSSSFFLTKLPQKVNCLFLHTWLYLLQCIFKIFNLDSSNI